MTLIKSIFAAAAVLTALTGSAAFARDTTPAVPACCAKGNCCAAGRLLHNAWLLQGGQVLL